MARQKGLEPLTYWFVASHSIQLSYWRMHMRFLRLIMISHTFIKCKCYFQVFLIFHFLIVCGEGLISTCLFSDKSETKNQHLIFPESDNYGIINSRKY